MSWVVLTKVPLQLQMLGIDVKLYRRSGNEIKSGGPDWLHLSLIYALDLIRLREPARWHNVGAGFVDSLTSHDVIPVEFHGFLVFNI